MIHFNKLTQEENTIANKFLEEALAYFECTKQIELFNQFFNLFNQLTNENTIKNITVIDAVNVSTQLQSSRSSR